ncbi:hypothetical protein JTB14_027332 [Gonioctena quinquepunctata]|nr:hypothetical protein JTB14_027332 [Gonioctena quinquepunctata]
MNDIAREKTWREKRNKCLVVLIIIFVVLLSTFIITLKMTRFTKVNVCISEECVTSSVFFANIIDNSSDPCENFYNFSCGNYDKSSTVKHAQGKVDRDLKYLITGSINKDDSRSVKSQKKYYRACMDTINIEDDANDSLKAIFEQLGGWPLLQKHWNETYSWAELVTKCIELGLYYDWFVDIENEPTLEGSYDRLHIKPPSNAIFVVHEARNSYQLLIENVANILSSTEGFSVDEIADLINFENNLFQIIMETRSNSTESTVNDILDKFPSVPWKSLLENVVVDNDTKIFSSVDSYIPSLQRLLNNTNSRVQANYIMWKIIQSLRGFLSSDIRKEFEVDEDLRQNIKADTRAQYCYGITNTVFSYVSEAVYARRYEAERIQVRQIIENIKTVLYDHIQSANWMNQTHKNYAISKLRNLGVIVGAPEETYNEKRFEELLGVDKIDILDLNNTLDIVRTVDKSRDKYNLNFRQKKINYKMARFYQGIAIILATKYIPDENMMFLPAASLSGIFFSNNRPVSLNYGALGTIIAHELSHGFGILDTVEYIDGKERIIWSNSTIQAFLNASDCLLEDCEAFNGNETKINCQSTFDENFADYASIDISYEAFKKIDSNNQLPGSEYTPSQSFWISFASTMCNNLIFNSTEDLMHMLPSQRIIGSYRNSKYFAKDFHCPVGRKMNPVKKCSVL